MNQTLKRKDEIERRLYFLIISEMETPEILELENELKEIDTQLCERCGGSGEEYNGNDPNPPVCFECGGTGYKQ